MSYIYQKRNKEKKRIAVPIVLALASLCIVVIVGGSLIYSNRTDVKKQMAAQQITDQTTEAGESFLETEKDVSLVNISGDKELYQIYRQALGDLYLHEDGSLTYQGKDYKRNSHVKAILFLGVDRKDELNQRKDTQDRYSAGNADAIYLIAQDVARDKLKILMIPRDSMTPVNIMNPDGSYRGYEAEHLTLAFANGDGYEGSTSNMVEAVEHLLCGLKIDHHFVTDLKMLEVVNDEVGGVSVTIPNTDMETADPTFIQGKTVTLKGQQAERFLRYRDIHTDNSALYRMNQHREYIKGFFQAIKKKQKSDSNIITKLFDKIQDYLLTDMYKDEYMKLALDGLQGTDITDDTFLTLQGMGTSTETYDEFYVNYTGTIPIILELFYREAG